MCRMLAAYAWSREGSRLLASLTRLLADAASGDPYLARITGGESRHCHGYGYVLAWRARGSWTLEYRRFDAAGLSPGRGLGEAGCVANLEGLRSTVEGLASRLSSLEEVYLVIHARRAGRREPRGTLHTHPFRVEAFTREGPIEVYLAHNGGVSKDILAARLGLEPGAYTDSHLLAIWLSRSLEGGLSVEEALADAWCTAKSGFDVAVLHASSAGPGLSLAAGASRAVLADPARLAYYQPVLFEGEGVAGFVSSTVADFAAERGLPLRFNRLGPERWGVYTVGRERYGLAAAAPECG